MDLFNQQTYTLNYELLYGLICIFVMVLVCAISMWVMLAKKGDERRKFIIKDTCHKTFIITTVIMLADLIFRVLVSNQLVGSLLSSAIILGGSSLVFIVIFLITRYKNGN